MSEEIVEDVLELPLMRSQQYELYEVMKRWNCWVCHRRFGKTILGLEILVAKAAECELLDPRFAYFAPTRTQAKDIAWTYLQRFVEQIDDVDINQSELRVELPHNGAHIRLYGTDNYKLGRGRRGLYYDGVVIDEYADIAPAVWTQVIRPALSDRKGWAIFVGTPRGKNHFYRTYQNALARDNWSVATYRADQTGIVDPEELEDARQDMSEAEFAQEYLCSWDSPMPGAVYADQIRRLDQEGRAGYFPYDPNYPVGTAWDIGPANTAIWFWQQIGNKVRFIDYEEGPGDLPKWISIVKAKPYVYDHSKLTPPLTRNPYERHYGPHDLETGKDYATSKKRTGIALEQGFRFTVIPRGPVEDGIEVGRRLMDVAEFDELKCEAGLNALRSYRYEYDETTQTFRKVPVHDWASHGADAFRYCAIGLMPPKQAFHDKPGPGTFAWTFKNIDKLKAGQWVG